MTKHRKLEVQPGEYEGQYKVVIVGSEKLIPFRWKSDVHAQAWIDEESDDFFSERKAAEKRDRETGNKY